MARGKPFPKHNGCLAPLDIDELEAGLRLMDKLGADRGAFWDSNVEAFRQTVLLAIRDTSNAVSSSTITDRWREDLSGQLAELLRLLEFADRHIAARECILKPYLH